MSEELVGAAAVTCRFAVGFLFLVAAIPKLVERREFERTVRSYALLPSALVPAVASWLPRLELACAILLLLGLAAAPAAALAACLLAIFAVAVGINLVRGREISCGCFSTVAPRKIGWSLVAGDILLAAMAGLVAVRMPGALAVAPAGGGPDVIGNGEAVAALVLASSLTLGFLLPSAWRGFDTAAKEFARHGAGA